MSHASRVVRGEGLSWPDVPLLVYKNDGSPFRDITRRALLGDAPGEAALDFLVRYFEVQAGGYSTLERHQHPRQAQVAEETVEVVQGDGFRHLSR